MLFQELVFPTAVKLAARGSVSMSKSNLRTETIDQSIYAGTVAFKLMVEFKDGDVLHGTILKYTPDDKVFFLIPLNPGDKSERIYLMLRQ